MFSFLRRTKRQSITRYAAGIVLAVLILCMAVALAWVVRSPLPKVDGTLEVRGLSAAVTIRRDQRGIPHITASSERDLFFAQGFACAQDRLWQMDTLRRQAQGRLSEIAGPAALQTDRYMRTLGFEEAAQNDWRRLGRAARDDLAAYASGVNATISTHALPLEFALMGYRPRPWTPVDSISVVKLMAQRLDDQWSKLVLRADLTARIGSTSTLALTDTSISELEEYIPGYRRPSKGMAFENPVDLGWSRYRNPVPVQIGTGSNNWTVRGQLTTTGKPVLANDTHLAHSLPSTWWLSHLRGAGFNVEGFQIPGLPGVILGHNERIGFGVTSAAEPVQDVFVERFRSARSDEYLANGRWLHARHRWERIAIKGSPEQVLDVLVTRHGPIIERRGTKALALAWTVLQEGGEIQALRSLDLAANWDQFRGATQFVVGPALNFVYADVGGNIGYQDVGRFPKRRNGDGTLPVEGQDDRFAWSGTTAFRALPHAFNPPSSMLATANNNVTSQTNLTAFADAPYRVHRIYTRLRQLGRKTPQQVGMIQADVFDYPRTRLAILTAQQLAHVRNQRLVHLAMQLRSWNGMADTRSHIATFLSVEDDILAARVLRPKIGAELLERYQREYHAIIPLLRVVDGDKRLAKIGITRKTILEALPAVAARAADAVRVSGQGVFTPVQTWGESNAASYDHPLGRFWPLNALLNLRLSQPGNTFTVYAGRQTFGPSQRLVIDFANWDNSSMLLTLGESGHFSDPHYADEADDFVNVRWVPTPFSEAAVQRATKDTLVLKPKG